MVGHGKYDPILSAALKASQATQGLLIVLDGRHGPGFSCQFMADSVEMIPGLLRHVADDVAKDTSTQSIAAAIKPNKRQ